MKEIDYEDEINSNINIDIDKNINITEEQEKENIININIKDTSLKENKNKDKDYSQLIKDILEDNSKEKEYLNIIKNSPSSLFDIITDEKLKSWEEKLFSEKIDKLIKTDKGDQKIISSLTKINPDYIKEKDIILNDCTRTRVRESELYLDYRNILEKIIFFYCYKRRANYKQGLNEIFGGLLLIKYKLKNYPLSSLINIGSALIDKFLPNYFYEKKIYSLKSALALFKLLLKYHEPTLYNKLDIFEINPELFATNWLINYQSGKLPLNIFYYFFDKMISISDSLFIQFFLVALIQYHRDILIHSDKNYLPALIMNLQIKSYEELDLLFNKAFEIRNNTPYSFRLWVNKIGFLRKNYKDIELNYKKYQPELFMTLPLFSSEVLYLMNKDYIKCFDSRCKNYIKNLCDISPELELKKRHKNATNKNNNKYKYKSKDYTYNLNHLEILDQNHLCEKCNMKLEKNFKFFLFDLRMYQTQDYNSTGALPTKIPISQEELKSLDFSQNLTQKFVNKRGTYHFIFLNSDTDYFNKLEKKYYTDNITEEDKKKIIFGLIEPIKTEKELNFNEAKKYLNFDETFKLKEYDNMKKTITSMIKKNFPYVSYVYGGYNLIHKECKRFKVNLIGHNEEKCFLCNIKKNNNINQNINIKETKAEEKNMLYKHLWEEKEKIKYNNLNFFINNPHIKVYLGALKFYKNQNIENDKIQILLTEKFDTFELLIYKFDKENQYHEFENTIMLLDEKQKKEFYDLGQDDDEGDETNDKNLELTLLEKIGVKNIISIKRNQNKINNVVNIEIRDNFKDNIVNKFIKTDNNNDNNNYKIHNIIVDFSSDKDSKNFISSFKSLINLYKSTKKSKNK